ncbi:MAG TPA: 4Fe-4S binding protein [Spirochaetota bacterium]|nr:4Fe-4S binding protein [Spirochaetota bacterium]HOM39004.1 4Fe-4S binding protein [Spirochaetota bacterium]
MKRKVVVIDEKKCNGCGLCVSACAEGALQLINGKALLINEVFCDGLGACVGECPVGAISIEERDVNEYDEIKTLQENIIPKGRDVILMHLLHLKNHGGISYYNQAIDYLKANNFADIVDLAEKDSKMECCNFGSSIKTLEKNNEDIQLKESSSSPNRVPNWPIQLTLVNPFMISGDVVIAADCTGFSTSLSGFLKNDKKLVIACPKLDKNIDMYIEKLKIAMTNINTITVLRMEVPCCSGLVRITEEAVRQSGKKVPIKEVVIGISGNIIKEEWV